MKKIGFVASLILMVSTLFAQDIKEGKQFLTRQRYQSAENVFRQILAKDPNNTEAAYWLGQTYLDGDRAYVDTAAAKALYQKMLQANPNDELMMVGMGEINLMEGNKDAARNQFEAAINKTKKRDLPEILYAVGRANIEPDNGDFMYGIQKLQQATEKDEKNPELYNWIGIGYWKLHDGSNATANFQKALTFDPYDALASFYIGRIYQTQGYGQEPIYMRYFMDAMREDSKFAPVYYWLYTYYYNRDVNKAADYLNKYIANADNDSKNCYAKASLLFVSKKFQQSIDQANACIDSTGNKSDPNLYGLKGYAYNELGDSLKSKEAFDKFFAVANPEKIGPGDYKTYGQVLLKIPGQEAEGIAYINKAIDKDTLLANKIKYATDVAESLAKDKKYAEAGQWYGRVLQLDTAFTKTDLFYAGYDDFLGGNYKTSDSVFKIYQQKYPGDVYGWYLGAHAVEAMDTAETGKAQPLYQKVIEIGDTTQDKSTIQDKLIPSYRYMVAYYYNLKSNVDSAIYYNDKILELNPNDANATQTKQALETVAKQQKEAAEKAKSAQKASAAKK
jgi:tetratricopeptide (TPR) repeat protein